MKRFNILKTVQICIFVFLAVTALIVVFKDRDLYQMIGTNPHIMILSIILWLVLGLSFIFMFIDINSYQKLQRENSELDLAVFNDPLTGMANRYRCDAYISQFKGRVLPENMGCITLLITNLKEINNNKGHAAGDEEIKEFSDILEKAAANRCFIGRNGGNKFLAVFDDCSEEDMEEFLNEVRAGVTKRNDAAGDGIISYIFGTALNEGDDISDLIALSDGRAARKIKK